MNTILKEDLLALLDDPSINYDKFYNKTFLITGATGLLGGIIVDFFHLLNKQKANISCILIVRNKERAKNRFKEYDNISYIESSVENLKDINMNFDYVIHLASPTKSKFFIENPVETLNSSILGTQKLLDLCKNQSIKKFLYLSSMEMYGTLDDKNVTEDKLGYIDNLDVRSSYSLAKRVAELYCYTYYKEYNVPTLQARLAMTFGSGINKNESRVYKYFCDAMLNGEDVVVKSTGNTLINFIYTTDAIKGILLLLDKGKLGESYNLTSDFENKTIMDMANYIASLGNVRVKQEIPNKDNGYAPDNLMALNNEKIKAIGFKPSYTLEKGINRLIQYIEEGY